MVARAHGTSPTMRLSLIAMIGMIAGCAVIQGTGRPSAAAPVPKRFMQVDVPMKKAGAIRSTPIELGKLPPSLPSYTADGRTYSSLAWSLVAVDEASRRLVVSIDEGTCARPPASVLLLEDSATVKVTVLAGISDAKNCTLQRTDVLASIHLARPLAGRVLLRGML